MKFTFFLLMILLFSFSYEITKKVCESNLSYCKKSCKEKLEDHHYIRCLSLCNRLFENCLENAKN